MSPRAVFVLTAGRSGSSAVAGALQRLGVDMGESIEADWCNPRGYYEDSTWYRVTNYVLQGRDPRPSETYAALIAARDRRATSECPVWGVKLPRLVEVWDRYVLPRLEARPAGDVRAVIADRDEHAAAASYVRARGCSEEQALRLVRRRRRVLDALGGVAGGPAPLRIDFDELVAAPDGVIWDLARFVFEGMPGPSPAQMAAATGWIEARQEAVA